MSPEVRSRSSSPEVSSFKATTEAAELRKQFEEIKNKLQEVENRSKEPLEPISRQLFGKEYKQDEMVLLKNNIYCRKRIYEMAMGCSFRSTHIARRLLEGVFKRDALIKCTLTGQSPKSQGKEQQMMEYDCLDRNAKMAIIEFALEAGKTRGWKPEPIKDLNRSLSQKIGEVKRQYKRHI